jgi:hypothetical protein
MWTGIVYTCVFCAIDRISFSRKTVHVNCSVLRHHICYVTLNYLLPNIIGAFANWKMMHSYDLCVY